MTSGWLKAQMQAAERSISSRPAWVSASYSDDSRLVPASRDGSFQRNSREESVPASAQQQEKKRSAG